jgi:hypothetical protein
VKSESNKNEKKKFWEELASITYKSDRKKCEKKNIGIHRHVAISSKKSPNKN